MMYCPEMKKDLENECIAYKSMLAGAQEAKDLKDKLHRRNMQIKELKKESEENVLLKSVILELRNNIYQLKHNLCQIVHSPEVETWLITNR